MALEPHGIIFGEQDQQGIDFHRVHLSAEAILGAAHITSTVAALTAAVSALSAAAVTSAVDGELIVPAGIDESDSARVTRWVADLVWR